MRKYRVNLNALACVGYTVEANSPEEALKLVMENDACLDDASAVDWDFECPGEITDLDEDFTIQISQLETTK